MPTSSSYSFLDVVVLDDVRERFAAGDALVILSQDLEDVIWANGPGAVLFGYDNIEEIIGSAARLGFVTKRQIKATSGYPAIGRGRSLLVRLTTGMTSSAVLLQASAIRLPDGEEAILLASAVAGGSAAQRAVGGFSEPGRFVALVDSQGAVAGASAGFDRLGLAQDALIGMIERLAGGQGRIAKRMLAGARGPLPAGLARLADEPALHLLVVVDENPQAEPLSEAEPANTETQEPTAESPAPPHQADGPQLAFQPAAENLSPALDDAGLPIDPPQGRSAENGHDSWYFSKPDTAGLPVADDFDDGQQELLFDEEVPQVEGVSTEAIPPAAVWEQPEEREPEVEAGAEPPAAESVAAAERESAAPAPDNSNVPPVEPTRSPERVLTPVRFVWRTDADGKFSQISPEFAGAVGQEAADIVGRSFEDVALTFGLDPAGEIAGLLSRRDTWSGRSVFWPIAGTDLRIPVDLAALPVYSRNRDFEGFRGFGVARAGDAIADPEKLGLVLTRPAPAESGKAAVNPPLPAPSETAARESDPFQGEVPALSIAPMPDRRFTDKVIRLAEHRQPVNDKGLTTGERIAFQQIGERLKKDAAEPLASAPIEETSQADASLHNAGEPSAEPVADAADDDSPADVFQAAEPEASVDPASEPAEEAPVVVPDVWEQDDTSPEAAGEETPSDAVTAETLHESPAADQVVEAPMPAQQETADRKTPRSALTLLDLSLWEQDDDRTAPPADASSAIGSTQAGEAVQAEDGEASDSEGQPSTVSEVADDAAGEPEPQDATGDVDAIVGENPLAEAPETALPEAVPPLPHYDPPPRKADAATAAPARSDTSILEKLPVPVLVHSGDVLHYANGEFLCLTGYESIEDLWNAGGIGALFADSYDREDGEERTDHQLRLKSQGGDEFPVEAFLQSVPWNGGKALLLVLNRLKDGAAAASQSPLVAELEARVAEMRTIIDTATDGVVLISRDGTVRSISRPAEALFGFDSDEVAGKPFASLFAMESQRAARDYLNGLSDNGVASVLNDGREVIGRESQGRFIPLFMTIGRLPSDSGFCAVVRDITQWKRAEEELTQARAVAERASSHKTDFLARVSHEIRTPLNAIIGFSELMIDEKFGPVTNDRYRDYLRDINRSGNHVLDLVNDLLDISKIEAGQQDMAYEAVSLNDTLAETVAMMQPQANRERVIIRSSFASKLPDVVADLRSVRQIALNILSNAVRYTQAGGQVIVSTSYESSGDVAMRVRDTGIGMTQAEIEQALKPFKQINSLKRARGDGTGLGLPLTKAMVEANRAKFVINSSPGEGTLVEITFPSTRVLAD